MAKKPMFGGHKDPGVGGVAAFSYDPNATSHKIFYSNADAALMQAQSDLEFQRNAGQFLNPAQFTMFKMWQQINPTTDPRTYLPLAQSFVDPNSSQGKQVSKADVTAQVASGSYDLPASPAATSPVAPASAVNPSPFGTPTSPFAPVEAAQASQPGSVLPQNESGGPLTDMLNAGGDVLHAGTDASISGVGTAARGAQYVLQSGYDAGQAVIRSTLGDQQKAMNIAKQNGLSQDEAMFAFPQPAGLTALAGKDLYTNAAGSDVAPIQSEQPQQDSGGISGFFERFIKGLTHGATHQSETTTGSSLTADQIPADRMALIEKARHEYQTGSAPSVPEFLSAVAKQTPVGAIAENPSLLTQDSGLLASSPKVMANTDAASLTAFDLRTAEEVRKGIQPIGWTPGRGIAHLAYSPDEQAFYNLSGAIDFTANLTMDPANLLPVDMVPKVFKGLASGSAHMASALGSDSSRIPWAIERAMQTGGKKVAVQTSLPSFAKKGMDAVTGGYMSAKDAARGKAVMDSLDIAGRRVDPDVLARAEAKDAKEGITSAYSSRVTKEGLVTTPHGNFVASQAAWDFVNSKRGERMVNDLVNSDSPAEIWLRSNGKMTIDQATQFANAKTPEEVRAALSTSLGLDLNDPKALRNFGSNAPAILKDSALRDHPLWNWLRKAPQQVSLDLENIDHSVTQITRFARGARLPWEAVRPHIDALINSGDSVDRYKALYGDSETGQRGLMDAVADHLVSDAGISPARAKQVTQAFEGGLDSNAKNYVNRGISDVFGAGDDGNIGSAMLTSELFNRLAVLPDYRVVRQLGSSVAKIERHVGLGSIREGDAALRIRHMVNETTTAWKSLILVRPAYVAREVGESLFSASLAGHDSAFTNPARYASLVFGAMAAHEINTVTGRLAKSFMTGHIPTDVADKAMVKSATAGDAAQKVGAKVYKVGANAMYGAAAAPKAVLDASHLPAVADYLALRTGMGELMPAFHQNWMLLNGEPMMKALNDALNDKGGEHTIPTFYDGLNTGSEMNLQQDQRLAHSATHTIGMAEIGNPAQQSGYIDGLIDKIQKMTRDPDMRNIADPEMDPAKALQHFRSSGRRDMLAKAQPQHFANRTDAEVLDGYRTAYTAVTAGDEKISQAILDGTFDGVKVDRRNKALRAHIQSMVDDEGTRPSMIQAMPYDKATRKGTVRDALADTSDRFFKETGTAADLFARSPMFRDAYVKSVSRIASELTPAAKADIVKRLRDAGDVHLARAVQSKTANGFLDANEAHLIAASEAREEMARIFYSAHEQQNYAVAMRAIAPFAQATFNTFRRWGEFSLRSPNLMYRSVKPFVYGQQQGSASIYGALGSLYGQEGSALWDPSTYAYETPDQRANGVGGFIYTDPQFGDQKFVYPAVGPLGNFLGATQPGMLPGSSLSGLNVAGTTLQPGAGWMLTLPLSLVDAPQQWLTDKGFVGDSMRFMFPYGLPQGSTAEKLVAAFSPSWFAKMAKSSDEVSALPNMTTKLMPVVMANGKYDLQSPSDQARLLNDSKRVATGIWLWNAIMGSFTPSTINTEVAVQDTGSPTDASQVLGAERVKVINAMAASGPGGVAAAQRFTLQSVLHNEWNKYVSGPGTNAYQNGMLNFVHDHGPAALMSVLPRSQGVNQATNDVWQFATDHPDTYNTFAGTPDNPGVIGLFFAAGSVATSDPGPTGYSDSMYARQKQTGERVLKTPNAFLKDALDQWGWMLWDQKASEIEQAGMKSNGKMDNSWVSAQKADVKEQIRALTNGSWTGEGGSAGDRVAQMTQLESALKDPVIQTLSSAKVIQTYMDARANAIQRSKARNTGVDLSSTQNVDLANSLYQTALGLYQQDPSGAFSNIWHRLLEKELGG